MKIKKLFRKPAIFYPEKEGAPPQAAVAPPQGAAAPAPAPAGPAGTIPVGPGPQSMQCPNCKNNIITTTKDSPSVMAWVLCVLIVFVGCWCGCCLIPLCIQDCQTVQHYCPECNAFVGKHSP